MSIFDHFVSLPYTFLQLGSTVEGNAIISTTQATGIIKLRDSMIQVDNMENFDSESSIHIRASEPFLDTVGGNMVGHGLRISKDNHEATEYRIISQREGYDFDSGELDFYRVVLKREAVV